MFRWFVTCLIILPTFSIAKVQVPGPEKYTLAMAYGFHKYLQDNEKNIHLETAQNRGMRLIGGQKLNDFFSLQLQANMIGEAKINSAFNATFNTGILSYGFNGVFHVPVYFWNPFFKLGVQHWELGYRDASTPELPVNGMDLYYGFGVRFDLTPYAALFLEIERYEIDNAAILSNTIGGLIRF